MAEDAETPSTTEETVSQPETKPAAPEATQPAPEAPASVAAPEAKPEPEKPATADLSPIPLEELVQQREDLRRYVQSEKDKEIAKERRRYQDDQRRRTEEDNRLREEAERRRLLDAEDYEGLGRVEAERFRDAETLGKAASTVSGIIEKTVREHPDFAGLGAERIDEVYKDVERGGGSVVDFTLKLAEERRKIDVEQAVTRAAADIDTKIRTEVEAALAGAGLAKREQQTQDGETPSEKVSAGGAPKPTQGEITYEKASELYGDGELSFEEFKPYLDEHNRQKRR